MCCSYESTQTTKDRLLYKGNKEMTIKGLDNCRDQYGDLLASAMYYTDYHATVCAACVSTGKVTVHRGHPLKENCQEICFFCRSVIKGAVNHISTPKIVKQKRSVETIA